MNEIKIYVFSDSHGSTTVMEKLLSSPPEGLSAVFHLGDGDDLVRKLMRRYPALAFIGVPGNCDHAPEPDLFSNAAPDVRAHTVFTEYGGVRMMLTHGHKYHVKFSPVPAAKKAAEGDAKILLYGHTHIQSDALIHTAHGDVRAVNPGSVRDGRYAVLTVSDGVADFELLTYPALPRGAESSVKEGDTP